MSRRLTYLGAVLALIMAGPAGAQQVDKYTAQKAQALDLFLHGKVNAAVRIQQTLITAAPSLLDKVALQRDLMQMCAAAQDWPCVMHTVYELVPIVRSDPRLASFRFDLVAYGARVALWKKDDDELAKILASDIFAAGNALDNPAAAAELELALHDHSFRTTNLKEAERHLSTAIQGLLLSGSYDSYRLAEVAIGILRALVRAQDIVGATTLANMLAPIMPKLVPNDSVAAAQYLMLSAHLSAFTSGYSETVAAFIEASRALEQLDIDEGARIYDMAIANNLATAALLVAGRVAEAEELHAHHPLQNEREKIIGNDEFRSTDEFYFGVSDVFVSEVAKSGVDLRWKRVFEAKFSAKFGEVDAIDFESYRNFALGILALESGDVRKSAELLKLAARQRIDNFETIIRANFEGFPLPSLMDRIVIWLGLSPASHDPDREDLNLMLRGSDVLGRNLRHGRAAVLLGSQMDDETRRSAQSYFHLLRRKRDWELDQIGKLLARDGTLQRTGDLIREYQGMMKTLAGAKERLFRDKKLAPANGLPTLAELQRKIPPGHAFVTYFVSLEGWGKLCIERDRVTHATARFAPEVIMEATKHARLIEFATTASHHPNRELDAQFPVPSAIYMRDHFFGGLEACLRPGTHVTVAMPGSFAAGVPLGALLAEALPARAGGGYDLAKAHWLIRDLSFSRVVSAREYIATMSYLDRPPAPRPYLGVGDPKLDKARISQLASTPAFRGSVPTRNGIADFGELPETAEELRAVGGLFGASASDVLTRDDAGEKSLRARPLGDYDVLHFATHGLVKQDLPGLAESALLLTPGDAADRSDDGLLSASEISHLALNARLVVLSACNTAQYDIAQATLGVQDLQTAFTVAGAPTLLASLWPVESTAARDITINFFKEWRSPQTDGAADALARATRAYLDNADAAHQHPRFWAPFVVLGNGAVRGAPAP